MGKGEENVMAEYEDDTYSSDDEGGEPSAEYLEEARKFQEARMPEYYTPEQIERDLRTYDHQVATTEGFDVDYFPSLEDYYCMITPYSEPNSQRFRECAQFALQHFNKDNDSKYELVNVLIVTTNAVGPEVLRMTFEGKDENGVSKIFLGIVFDKIPDKYGNPDREFMGCKLKTDQ